MKLFSAALVAALSVTAAFAHKFGDTALDSSFLNPSVSLTQKNVLEELQGNKKSAEIILEEKKESDSEAKQKELEKKFGKFANLDDYALSLFTDGTAVFSVQEKKEVKGKGKKKGRVKTSYRNLTPEQIAGLSDAQKTKVLATYQSAFKALFDQKVTLKNLKKMIGVARTLGFKGHGNIRTNKDALKALSALRKFKATLRKTNFSGLYAEAQKFFNSEKGLEQQDKALDTKKEDLLKVKDLLIARDTGNVLTSEANTLHTIKTANQLVSKFNGMNWTQVKKELEDNGITVNLLEALTTTVIKGGEESQLHKDVLGCFEDAKKAYEGARASSSSVREFLQRDTIKKSIEEILRQVRYPGDLTLTDLKSLPPKDAMKIFHEKNNRSIREIEESQKQLKKAVIESFKQEDDKINQALLPKVLQAIEAYSYEGLDKEILDVEKKKAKVQKKINEIKAEENK